MRLTMRCCKKQMKGADNRRLKIKYIVPRISQIIQIFLKQKKSV